MNSRNCPPRLTLMNSRNCPPRLTETQKLCRMMNFKWKSINCHLYIKTQLPYDYYFLDYCKPMAIKNSAENLGEVLRGDRIENSVYNVRTWNPLIYTSPAKTSGITWKEKKKVLWEAVLTAILFFDSCSSRWGGMRVARLFVEGTFLKKLRKISKKRSMMNTE